MLKVMSFINTLQHRVTLNQALVTLVLLLNAHLLGLTTAPPFACSNFTNTDHH